MTSISLDVLHVPHIIHGEVHTEIDTAGGHATRVGRQFVVPPLNLDQLVLPRRAPGPAFDTPLSEILELLDETGRRLDIDTNQHLAAAAELMTAASPHSQRVIEQSYRQLGVLFDAKSLAYQVETEIVGGASALDGWLDVVRADLPAAKIRAFPPRLVHVMAGNGPQAASISIVRGALTKGINLLKLPSNDLFTAIAILRTMAEVAPGHPTVRSFSAVYWRGGDQSIESLIYRPQYFDKLVAWGGEATIRHVAQYVGPGFELVNFDPKTSISLIGREAFRDNHTLAAVVEAAAADASLMNQEACVASRHQFVEGEPHEIDQYCALLAEALAHDRDSSDGKAWRVPSEIRDTVEAIDGLPGFGTWGGFDGEGLVVKSEEPMDFHPIAKTVNVIPVNDIAEANRFANVATQTVGVYPAHRKREVRDALAVSGVQRVVTLGHAIGLATTGFGLPHDGAFPLQRLMRWVTDEDL